jgi:hypothetical protein
MLLPGSVREGRGRGFDHGVNQRVAGVHESFRALGCEGRGRQDGVAALVEYGAVGEAKVGGEHEEGG